MVSKNSARIFRSEMRAFHTLIAIFIYLVCTPLSVYGEEEAAAETVKTEAQNLDLIEAYKWSNSLPKELIDLQIAVDSLSDITNLENELAEISDLIEELEWDSVSLRSNPNLTFYAINTFEGKLNKLNIRLNRINKPLQKKHRRT